VNCGAFKVDFGMAKSYSVSEALNLLPALTGLLIDLGGDVSEFLNRRAVWLSAEIGAVPATLTSPARDIIKPTKDYFLHLAALASEVEKLLVEHAERHSESPASVAPIKHGSAAKSSI
jgi:hypothetical protein